MNPNYFTDEQIWWNAVLLVVFVVAFLVIAGYAVKRYVEHVSFPCVFCNATVQALRQLSKETRRTILCYFRDVEGREPDTSGIFLCPKCHHVYDDFSGQKQTREHNNWGCVTFCKVCTATMSSDPDGAMRCSRCNTPYRWERYGGQDLIFLMPPPGTRVVRSIPPDRIDSLQSPIEFPGYMTRIRVKDREDDAGAKEKR